MGVRLKRLYSAVGLLLLGGSVAWAAPDTTLSVTPSATAGTTITASDENARNNSISTAYNSHSHTDISTTSANTYNFGDGAAGNKNLCANAADGTDACIRWNDTANLWTVDNPTPGSFNEILTASGTAGLTARTIVLADGTSSLLSAGAMTNGQLLIGSTGANPTVASLTAGSGITITPGAGTISISTVASTVSGVVTRNAGDVTTAGAAADFTGATVTMTTGAHKVLIGFSGNCQNTNANAQINLILMADGTSVHGTGGVDIEVPSTGRDFICAVTVLTDAQTAASHTYKMQWSTNAGTATMECNGTNSCQFFAQEMPN